MSGPRRYAQGTSVAPEKSRAELERLLRAHGATGFGYLTTGEQAQVVFELDGAPYRMAVSAPDPDQFALTPTRQRRSPSQVEVLVQAEIRRIWRALVLLVKAKLEQRGGGVSSWEREFLPWRVLPGGETVHEAIGPQLGQLGPGQVPLLLEARRAGGGS